MRSKRTTMLIEYHVSITMISGNDNNAAFS